MSTTQLVYGTSYFKSLATGGNVSQALVCLVDRFDSKFCKYEVGSK